MIWSFGELVGRRLLVWAGLSVAAGIALLALTADPWWHGIGVEAVAWGAIDAAIAAAGLVSARRGRSRAAGDPEAAGREARKLRRLLLVNAGLDVGYIVAGLAVAGPVANGDPFVAGNGWGVVIQGAFLLGFDAWHARRVPDLPS